MTNNLKLNSITEILSDLADSIEIPQNIRKNAETISELISNKGESLEARKNKATQLLGDMVSDLNIDMSTRTTLYQVISLVESLNSEEKV